MGIPEATQTAKVLMVGAGGIGCELLKTLVLTGFRHIHVIDMDTIEVSNLNRQFLFRKRHVGQSKAKVAREAVLKLRPDVDIVAHHANVKSSQFDLDFFQQFSLVLNGLDNLDARRHVNRLCLAASVPLVESGTTGYLGQVTVHVRGRTECYECQPKPAPKTYPVCTITSTPSKPVHCIVWAKDLAFLKLFGDKTQVSDLDVRSSDAGDEVEVSFFGLLRGESSKAYAARVCDRLFGHNIATALENEDAWKERRKPCPLFLADVFKTSDAQLRDGTGNGHAAGSGDVADAEEAGRVQVSAMAQLGLKNPQEIWSVKTNADVFLESVRLFLERRSDEVGKLTFDKDDQLALEFVTSAANLRAHSFGIPMQSLFDAKGIAGNIVHAIATTNAIISGLIVLEGIKLLNKDVEACRMTYCLEHPSKKLLLMPVEPFEPNPLCYVCSETPLVLQVNTITSTLREVVEKIVTRKLGASSPIIMQGSNVIYETGADLEEDMVVQFEKNLDKQLALFPNPIVNGAVITVEDLQTEFRCSIHIKHRETFSEEDVDGMVLGGLAAGNAVSDKTATEVGKVGNVPSQDGVLLITDPNDDGDSIVSPAEHIGSKSEPCKAQDRVPDDDDLKMLSDQLDMNRQAYNAQDELVVLPDDDDDIVMITPADHVGSRSKACKAQDRVPDDDDLKMPSDQLDMNRQAYKAQDELVVLPDNDDDIVMITPADHVGSKSEACKAQDRVPDDDDLKMLSDQLDMNRQAYKAQDESVVLPDNDDDIVMITPADHVGSKRKAEGDEPDDLHKKLKF